MKFSVFYHPQVYDQIFEIVNWYEKKQNGLGSEFVNELEKTIHVILQNPFSFAKRLKQSRQVKLNRFPYIIVYEVQKNTIELYNIIHTSRHPIRRIIKK